MNRIKNCDKLSMVGVNAGLREFNWHDPSECIRLSDEDKVRISRMIAELKGSGIELSEPQRFWIKLRKGSYSEFEKLNRKYYQQGVRTTYQGKPISEEELAMHCVDRTFDRDQIKREFVTDTEGLRRAYEQLMKSDGWLPITIQEYPQGGFRFVIENTVIIDTEESYNNLWLESFDFITHICACVEECGRMLLEGTYRDYISKCNCLFERGGNTNE